MKREPFTGRYVAEVSYNWVVTSRRLPLREWTAPVFATHSAPSSMCACAPASAAPGKVASSAISKYTR